MQRIIQINIAGRVISIEENAYQLLKDYITALERQFTGDEGREIIEDIEYRISELFAIRLQGGAPAIDKADVQKVIDTLGAASDLHDGPTPNASQGSQQYSYSAGSSAQNTSQHTHDRLLRDPFDKVVGGVCSGIAHYFDIDPVIVRLLMVVLFLTFGIGFLAYIIAWAIVPAARSREELRYRSNGRPMTIHDITKNVGDELQDLKRKGEQMSRELKDFFSKKK